MRSMRRIPLYDKNSVFTKGQAMNSYIVLKRKSPSAAGGISVTPGLETLGAGGTESWELSFETADVNQAAEISAHPDVKAIARTMPTSLIHPMGNHPSTPFAANPGPASWGIPFVGANTSAYTGEGAIVAVLDTGIDRTHPAFEGVELEEKDFSGDGDGDRQGHGTHCAGTIFGRDVGGKRIGIARGVQHALIGKVLRDNGGGESEMIFKALQWALEKKANVISMSLGFDFPGLVGKLSGAGWPIDLATSTALESYRDNLRMFDAIMSLLRANEKFGGTPLVVAAAGNESRRKTNPDFRIAASLPAAAEGVISVAAIGSDGAIADFSNYMAMVSAPGVDITSAWPGGQLNTISGTSMACPHVAGIAALWWEFQKKQGVVPNAKNIAAQLIANARRNVFEPAFDESDFGQGLVTAP